MVNMFLFSWHAVGFSYAVQKVNESDSFFNGNVTTQQDAQENSLFDIKWLISYIRHDVIAQRPQVESM